MDELYHISWDGGNAVGYVISVETHNPWDEVDFFTYKYILSPVTYEFTIACLDRSQVILDTAKVGTVTFRKLDRPVLQ